MKTPDEIATAIMQQLPDDPRDWDFTQMIVDGIQQDRAQRTLEVLHQRDPDSSCTITVFLDGDSASYTEEDIDPGAGYDRSEWEGRRELPDYYSPAFRAATLEALEAASDSPYIDGEPTMTVTVHIENDYEDGHRSGVDVEVPAPEDPEDLDNWWEDVVLPHTGDGHGAAHPKLGAVYQATVIAAAAESLVGKSREWA